MKSSIGNISAHLGEIDLGSVEQLPSHLPAMNKEYSLCLRGIGVYEGEGPSEPIEPG